MRILLTLAALAVMTAQAMAQPPREIIAADTIRLYVGQSRTFQFDQPISDIKMAVGGIAEVIPLTDRTFSIRALGPGEVQALAYGNDNSVHGLNVVVVSAPLVKIYNGDPKLERGWGYTAYHCTETGCGRPNPDITRAPDRTTIIETQTKPGGDSVTFQREYR